MLMNMKSICYITTLAVTIKAFCIPQLKYLSQNGFEVTVICSPDNELQDILGSSIRYVPIPIPRGVSFFDMIKAIREIKSYIKKNKIPTMIISLR